VMMTNTQRTRMGFQAIQSHRRNVSVIGFIKP
jgi:hypothetical protein